MSDKSEGRGGGVELLSFPDGRPMTANKSPERGRPNEQTTASDGLFLPAPRLVWHRAQARPCIPSPRR